MADIDIDGMLDNKPDNQSKKSYNSNNKGVSLYNDTNIIPKEVNSIQMKSTSKKFAIFTNGKITDVKIESLKKISSVLFKLGFTYRSSGYNQDKVDEEIRTMSNSKAEIYKLWSKAKADVNHHTVVSEAPTRISYEVAAGLYKRFLSSKDFFRCMYAKDTQILLGKDCDEPVNFIITFTNCGESSFSKKFKIEDAGSVWYAMKVCKEANIPVFNINNDDFGVSIKNHLKSTGLLSDDTENKNETNTNDETKPVEKTESEVKENKPDNSILIDAEDIF